MKKNKYGYDTSVDDLFTVDEEVENQAKCLIKEKNFDNLWDNIDDYEDKSSEDYIDNRENGLPEDNPQQIFPADGKRDWVIYKDEIAIRYREGPKDKLWMEEKDRNYISRLARERHERDLTEVERIDYIEGMQRLDIAERVNREESNRKQTDLLPVKADIQTTVKDKFMNISEIINKLNENDPKFTEIKIVGELPPISSYEMRMLLDVLADSPHVKTFWLGAGNMGTKLDLKGVQYLASYLRRDKQLKTFKIPGHVVDEHMPLIINALKANKSLQIQTLDIGCNNWTLDKEGADLVADLLRGNITINKLHIGWDGLVPKSVAKIVDALKERKVPMLSISFGHCIGDEGATKVAGFIKQQPALQTVILNNTNIYHAGFRALAKVIADHPSLRTMRLQTDNFNMSDEVDLILDAIEQGGTITDFKFHPKMNLTSEQRTRLKLLLENNHKSLEENKRHFALIPKKPQADKFFNVPKIMRAIRNNTLKKLDFTLPVIDYSQTKKAQTPFIKQNHIYSRPLLPLDDNHFALGGDDWLIRIFDTNNKLMKILSGHKKWVRALALLPDGKLASGAWDNTVRIWDIASGNNVKTLPGNNYCSALLVLPDNRLVSHSGNTIKIWDIASWKCLKQLPGHTGNIRAFALLSNGHLASAGDDNEIKIWDIENGKCIKTLRGHTSAVWVLRVLPDKRLASASSYYHPGKPLDSTIRIWNVETGKCEQILEGHTNMVPGLGVLTDGSLISGSLDKTIRIWDIENGKCTAQFSSAEINGLTVLANGEFVTTGAVDNTTVWKSESYKSVDEKTVSLILSAIEKETKIAEIDLSSIKLTDKTFELLTEILSKNSHIKHINFADNELEISNVALIRQLLNLKDVSVNGLSELAKPQLQTNYEAVKMEVEKLPQYLTDLAARIVDEIVKGIESVVGIWPGAKLEKNAELILVHFIGRCINDFQIISEDSMPYQTGLINLLIYNIAKNLQPFFKKAGTNLGMFNQQLDAGLVMTVDTMTENKKLTESIDQAINEAVKIEQQAYQDIYPELSF